MFLVFGTGFFFFIISRTCQSDVYVSLPAPAPAGTRVAPQPRQERVTTGWAFEVLSIDLLEEIAGRRAPGVYVVVRLLAHNQSSRTMTMRPEMFRLRDAFDNIYTLSDAESFFLASDLNLRWIRDTWPPQAVDELVLVFAVRKDALSSLALEFLPDRLRWDISQK